MKSSVPIHSEDYVVTQVYYESKDRTRIPMFIFYKKGLRTDGNNPTLMTGYGGFAVSETPSYKDYAVAWVEQGGVFAVPEIVVGAMLVKDDLFERRGGGGGRGRGIVAVHGEVVLK